MLFRHLLSIAVQVLSILGFSQREVSRLERRVIHSDLIRQTFSVHMTNEVYERKSFASPRRLYRLLKGLLAMETNLPFPRTVAANSPRNVLICELLLHDRFDDGIPHTHFSRWSAIMACWSTPKAEIASVSHRLMSYWAISVEVHTGHDSAPGSTFEPH